MTGNFSLFQHPLYKRVHAWSKLQCIENVISKPPPNDGLLYCTPRHDHFMGCWNFTLAGSRAYLSCPELPGFAPENFAYFDCLSNGSWYVHPFTGKEYANYLECRNYQRVLKETEEDFLHVYVSIAGFSISLLLLIAALVIFFSFRQLNCDRVAVHKNLFLSYVITDLFNVIYLSVVCLNESVLMKNPLWCQVLHVITQYAVVSNFAWMFCEGLFLHTLVMNALKPGDSLIVACFIIGWVVPLVLTAAYAGIRATLSDNIQFCWLYESSLQWITFAPVVLSMMINIIFLINIMRLLITKLRQLPEATQTRKAVRATGILIPLLGLQFLLFIKRPNDKESTLYDVYTYAVSVVVSLQNLEENVAPLKNFSFSFFISQGAFVSILYCFCNGEVLTLLQRRWYQHKVSLPGKQKRAQSCSGSTMYTFIEPMSQGNSNML